MGDIKDGLVKMILFTNLEYAKISGKNYNSVAVLKLTAKNHFDAKNLNDLQKENLKILYQEAKQNNFEIFLS